MAPAWNWSGTVVHVEKGMAQACRRLFQAARWCYRQGRVTMLKPHDGHAPELGVGRHSWSPVRKAVASHRFSKPSYGAATSRHLRKT